MYFGVTAHFGDTFIAYGNDMQEVFEELKTKMDDPSLNVSDVEFYKAHSKPLAVRIIPQRIIELDE